SSSRSSWSSSLSASRSSPRKSARSEATPRTAFIWDDGLARYRFTPEHPLDPRRLELTLELIRRLGLIDEQHSIVPARNASDAEMGAVLGADYVAEVRRASAGARDATWGGDGLGRDDVPIVDGMHDAAVHIVGASMRAAELVINGVVARAFSI